MRHLLDLTRVENPRVCLLPTASGDPQQSISDFYSVLDRFDCRPTHVSLFRMEREWVNLREHLLEQDLIYVGRWLDAEPDRDLARARPGRDHARGVGVRHPPRRPERGRDVLVRARDHLVRRQAPKSGGARASSLERLRVHYARDPERPDLSSGARSRAGCPRDMASTTARASSSRAPARSRRSPDGRARAWSGSSPDRDGVREMALRPIPLRPSCPRATIRRSLEMRELRRAKAKARHVVR